MSQNFKRDQNLSYNSTAIHVQDNGWVCLTDMWKAQGSPKNKNPNDWLRLEQTKELASVLKRNTGSNRIYESRRGQGGGTYGIPDLSIAYAEYLSPEFHVWALSAIKERIQEDNDPEVAYRQGRKRAIAGWKKQGKSDAWIQDRINLIDNQKVHVATLASHGVTNRAKQGGENGFAMCADAINHEILGCSSRKAHEILQVKRGHLRDNLKRIQLTALSFAVAMADEDIETQNLYGNFECSNACSGAARRVSDAARGTTRLIA